MDDSEYKAKKLKYFKEEGHLFIYAVALIALAFLGYTYFSYYKLSKSSITSIACDSTAKIELFFASILETLVRKSF